MGEGSGGGGSARTATQTLVFHRHQQKHSQKLSRKLCKNISECSQRLSTNLRIIYSRKKSNWTSGRTGRDIFFNLLCSTLLSQHQIHFENQRACNHRSHVSCPFLELWQNTTDWSICNWKENSVLTFLGAGRSSIWHLVRAFLVSGVSCYSMVEGSTPWWERRESEQASERAGALL